MISIQDIKVYRFLVENKDKWITNKQISQLTKVSPRTVRAKTQKFTELGLLDTMDLFPKRGYRLKAKRLQRSYELAYKAMREILKG